MKKLITLFLTATISISAIAQTTWKMDKMHSKLTFSAVHLGISNIDGRFDDFDVEIKSKQDGFGDAVFTLTTQVKSINTDVEPRDNHLRSADFFDVEKYPVMTYKSTSIKPAGDEMYILTGDLTMHGVTKTVSMKLWSRGQIQDPETGVITAGFQLTGELSRSDFKIGGKFPNAVIGDKIQIKADGEFKNK